MYLFAVQTVVGTEWLVVDSGSLIETTWYWAFLRDLEVRYNLQMMITMLFAYLA